MAFNVFVSKAPTKKLEENPRKISEKIDENDQL